jgi:hypothetical protein
MNKRIAELEATPGVSADIVQNMRNLVSNTLEKLKNPTNISLNTLQQDFITIQSQFNLINEQAKTAARHFNQNQVDAAATATPSDDSFNMYRFFNNILSIVTKYLVIIILIVLALLGGSLMSNRAIHQSISFRIYYMIYGSLLFPISYYIIANDFFTTGARVVPNFHALLAPLIPDDNLMAVTKVILFPFVYSQKNVTPLATV